MKREFDRVGVRFHLSTGRDYVPSEPERDGDPMWRGYKMWVQAETDTMHFSLRIHSSLIIAWLIGMFACVVLGWYGIAFFIFFVPFAILVPVICITSLAISTERGDKDDD